MDILDDMGVSKLSSENVNLNYFSRNLSVFG